MARIKVALEGANGWSEWQQPVRKRYRLGCCDCGLVHNLDFRLVSRNATARLIQFRAQRNERSTALMRRQNDFTCKPKKRKR